MATTRKHKRSRRGRGQTDRRSAPEATDRPATSSRQSARHAAADQDASSDASGRQRRSSRRNRMADEEAGNRPEPGASSRRNAKTSGGSGRSSRRAGARGQEADGGPANRRARSRQPQSKLKSALTFGGVGALCLLAIIGLLVWQPIMRGMKVDEIRQAEGLDVRQRLLDEFLEMVAWDQGLITAYLIHDADIAPATKLLAIERAYATSEGRTRLFPAAMAIARNATEGELRAKALDVGRQIFDIKHHQYAVPVTTLKEWASQSHSDQPDREVATAAIALIGTAHLVEGLEADRFLRGIINDATQDRTLVGAAIEALAGMTHQDNVASALMALSGPNAAIAIGSDELTRRTRNAIRVTHLEAAIDLLSHEDPRIQAFGIELFSAPNLSLGTTEQALEIRAGLATEVSKRLTADIFQTDPDMADALLKAIRSLKLIDTRERLIELIPVADYDQLPSTIADILGNSFIETGTDADIASSNAVLESLAKAVGDPERQRTICGAITRLDRKAMACDSLYDLTVTVIEQSGDAAHPEAISEAIAHLIGKIYLRPTLLNRFAGKPEEWKEFIAMDRPRREQWVEMRKWHKENHIIRRSQGSDVLREKSRKLDQFQELLDEWMRQNAPLPLTCTAKDIEDFRKKLNEMRNGLIRYGGFGRGNNHRRSDPIRGTDRPRLP